MLDSLGRIMPRAASLYGDKTALAIGGLHTGDLASMDEDGYIFIVDRKKDMILTAGYNVYPAELERVIAAHPSVALVAVGPRTDELKGEIAKAYVVLKDGAAGDADDIIRFCRNELAAYKVPREVQFVPDLPKTSTGKVMRRELHTLDPNGRGPRHQPREPVTAGASSSTMITENGRALVSISFFSAASRLSLPPCV